MTSLQEAFMEYAVEKTGKDISREEATDIAMSDLTKEVNSTWLDRIFPGWKEAERVERSLETIGLADTSEEAKEYLSQMTLRSLDDARNKLNISVYSEDDTTYFRFER